VIWVKLNDQPEIIEQLSTSLNSFKTKAVKSIKKVNKLGLNVVTAQATKSALKALLNKRGILPGVAGKVPRSSTDKIFSEELCKKDGLYHIKLDVKEYRFETKASALNALRKLETAKWASFSSKGRRTWQTTKSWGKPTA
jgi:hypothetical protein